MTGYAHIYVRYYCYYIVIQAAAIFTCSGKGQTALASSSSPPSTNKKKKETHTKSRRSLPPKVVVFYCYRSSSRPVVLSGDKQNRAGRRAGYSRAHSFDLPGRKKSNFGRRPSRALSGRVNKITFLGTLLNRAKYKHIYIPVFVGNKRSDVRMEHVFKKPESPKSTTIYKRFKSRKIYVENSNRFGTGKFDPRLVSRKSRLVKFSDRRVNSV